jgi:hypothetical protein
MAFSYVDYNVTTATTGPFSFAGIDGYLSVSHLFAYKNGVLLNPSQYTLSEDPPQITLTTAAQSGDVVRIRRITPNTEDAMLAPFQDGSILRARDLRTSQLQNLYVAQEFADFGVPYPEGDADAGDLVAWDGTEFVFVPPGALGLSDGTYGDIVVTGAGSVWRIKNGVYGDISVSGDGATWTLTSDPLPPDGTYGDVTVSAGGTVWTVDGASGLPPNAVYGDITVAGASDWHVTDGVYGDVTVSSNGSVWTVAGGVGGTLDGGDASSTYVTVIDGGNA